MTTPADELRTAADTLRPSSPAVEAHTTWVKIRPDAAAAIAKLLREIPALHEHDTRPDHGGCDWCGDEDWPCNDVRNALAAARAINRTESS